MGKDRCRVFPSLWKALLNTLLGQTFIIPGVQIELQVLCELPISFSHFSVNYIYWYNYLIISFSSCWLPTSIHIFSHCNFFLLCFHFETSEPGKTLAPEKYLLGNWMIGKCQIIIANICLRANKKKKGCHLVTYKYKCVSIFSIVLSAYEKPRIQFHY